MIDAGKATAVVSDYEHITIPCLHGVSLTDYQAHITGKQLPSVRLMLTKMISFKGKVKEVYKHSRFQAICRRSNICF